jgi:valyl-tRNA synthetase
MSSVTPAADAQPLDEKELERKLKKDQKAKEKEEKRLKAKAKEAARLQAQAASDGPKKSEKKQRKKAVEDENPEDFIDPDTPHGQKKFLASQMAKQYSPAAVEKSWYAWWESSGYFGADPVAHTLKFALDITFCHLQMSPEHFI